MRKRVGSAARIIATCLLAFYTLPSQKEEMVQGVSPYVSENIVRATIKLGV